MIDDLAYLPLIVDTGGIPVVLIENKNSNLGNAIMHLSLAKDPDKVATKSTATRWILKITSFSSSPFFPCSSYSKSSSWLIVLLIVRVTSTLL